MKLAVPRRSLLELNNPDNEDLIVSFRSPTALSMNKPQTTEADQCVNVEDGLKLDFDFCQLDQIKAVSFSVPCNL